MDFEAFFKITYGLYIVSSGNSNEKAGYIANTAFQVTAEPPQIAISCNKDNHTSKILDESNVYSISILKEDASPDIIGLFGYKTGKEVDKFENVNYFPGETGVPIVTEESIAWFECKIVNKFNVGTHVIYIGEIVNYDLLDEKGIPLTYDYYRNVKKGKAPKNAPTYIKPQETEVDKTSIKTNSEKNLGPRYQCLVCDHIYDPEIGDDDSGIAPGTPFEELPDDWMCPVCGAEKSDFVPLD